MTHPLDAYASWHDIKPKRWKGCRDQSSWIGTRQSRDNARGM